MNTASEYVKFGGFLGFSSIFLMVLFKDRDVVAAVFDASIACVIMAYAFKLLHSHTINLHNQVVREKRAVMAAQAIDDDDVSDRKAISDGGAGS